MPTDEDFPRSPEPYLFTDKPDPTVVECVRVREGAETTRQTRAHRAKLLAEDGVQQLIAVLGVAALASASFVTYVVVTRNAPSGPNVVSSPSTPPSTPPVEDKCVDSVTKTSLLYGHAYSCKGGAKLDFSANGNDEATIRCTCPTAAPVAAATTSAVVAPAPTVLLHDDDAGPPGPPQNWQVPDFVDDFDWPTDEELKKGFACLDALEAQKQKKCEAHFRQGAGRKKQDAGKP